MRRIFFFATTLLSLLISGCFLLPKEEDTLAPLLLQTSEFNYNVEKIKRGNIENRLIVEGKLVNRNRTALSFYPYGGVLKSMKVRVGSIVKRGDILAELDKELLLYDMKMQEMSLKTAELNYKKASSAGVSAVDQELAKIAFERQQLMTEQAKKKYNSSNLYAPFDGVIVFKDKEYMVGDQIPSYHILYSIADPNDFEIVYEGSREKDFSYGMEVDVELQLPAGFADDERNKIYKAFVSQTSKETPKEESADYRNSIFFQLKDGSISGSKMGMGCYISVVLESAEDVLILPKNLVQMQTSSATVFILEDGIRKERVVETGIITAREVQIIAGLEEGEEVIKR